VYRVGRSTKLFRFLRKKGKLMSAAEAEGHRQVLADLYRSAYGLEMHALQTDSAVVPPREVVDRVQGRSKADPITFLGSGYRDATWLLERLRANGYDVLRMQRILDLGVGCGRVLLHFLPFPLERHGCDVNPVAVEWASRVLGDFADLRLSRRQPPLPYAEGFFDLVIATSVLTHTPVLEQPRWLAEIGRVLKPGGCLIATVHDVSRVPKQHRAAGCYETGVERGLHMNTYLTAAKLTELWSPAFDILGLTGNPPRQTYVIARCRPREAALVHPLPQAAHTGQWRPDPELRARRAGGLA
jgi:SAM-dependent methyltransferase